MMEVLRFVFSSIWIFIGTIMIISALLYPVKCLTMIINRLIRSSTIKKQGWPPVHLDADGDIHREPKKE
jgi:hypothetical protein